MFDELLICALPRSCWRQNAITDIPDGDGVVVRSCDVQWPLSAGGETGSENTSIMGVQMIRTLVLSVVLLDGCQLRIDGEKATRMNVGKRENQSWRIKARQPEKSGNEESQTTKKSWATKVRPTRTYPVTEALNKSPPPTHIDMTSSR